MVLVLQLHSVLLMFCCCVLLSYTEATMPQQSTCSPADSYFADSNTELVSNSTVDVTTAANKPHCMSKCHLNGKCKSGTFSQANTVCTLYNISRTTVNTAIMKSGNNAKTFYKVKCQQTIRQHDDFISLVDGAKDCKDIFEKGWKRDGVYGIQQSESSSTDGTVYESILCDMTKRGGGWTVIQSISEGTVDFDRNWESYKHGFGDLNGDFWYGNDRLHQLTTGKSATQSNDLLIPFVHDNIAHAPMFDEFKVAGERDKYQLTAGKYVMNGFSTADLDNGATGSELLIYSNEAPFSTKDHNNAANNECQGRYGFGWWFTYGECAKVALNGKPNTSGEKGILIDVLHTDAKIQKVKMLIRRK